MTNVNIPLTDLPRSTSLDAGGNGTGTKATVSRKVTADSTRAFRDLLGAMTPTKKVVAKQSIDGSGPPRIPAAMQALSTAERPASADEPADLDAEAIDSREEEASPEGVIASVLGEALHSTGSAFLPTASAADLFRDRDHEAATIPRADPDDVTHTDVVSATTLPAVSVRHAAGADVSKAQSISDIRAALSTAADQSPKVAAVSQSGGKEGFDPPASHDTVDIRALMPAKVTVVAQETHFAPMPIALPVTQIADAVIAELPGLTQDITLQDTLASPLVETTVDHSPVRMLTVRLDPPELGEVTVHMRVKDGGLELRVVAADQSTAQLLQAQRDTLADLIRDTGYQVDSANVQIAASDAVSVSGSASAGHGSDARDAASAGLADGRRNQTADQGAGGGRQTHPQTISEKPDRGAVDASLHRGGAVYV